MSDESRKNLTVRTQIIQALLPSNIKNLDHSNKGVLELSLAKSLGYDQTSSIADELSNLEKNGIIKRTKDKTVKGQNRCQLPDDRKTIKKIYFDEQYEILKPQIRADFSQSYLNDLIGDLSKDFVEIVTGMSKKSDFLFTIIIENSTKQELLSSYTQFLDTYRLLGIEDQELSVYWLWYLLMAQSFKADAIIDDKETRQQMFKKMGVLIKNAINDRTILQKNSDNVRLIRLLLQNSNNDNFISNLTEKCESYLNNLEKYEDKDYQSSTDKLKKSLFWEYQRIEAQLKMNQGGIT